MKWQKRVFHTFLVLDLGFDVVNGVGRLHLQSDGLSGESLHENLHSSTKAQHQMQGRLLLDVVISECAPILKLFASKDQALLVGRNTCMMTVVRGLTL